MMLIYNCREEENMKSKRQLLKEFNKIQKDYVDAVRVGNQKRIEELADERSYIQLQIRRIENAEKK